jgi:hypothetical protein
MSSSSYYTPNYDNAPTADDKHLRFMEVLKEHSINQVLPIPEWELSPITRVEEKKCICSHPILNNYFITNEKTKTILVIGSDCMKRFLDPSLRCEECNAPIQNVVQRISEGNFICRECKQKRKRVVKDYKDRYIVELGKYYLKTFEEAGNDQEFVQSVLDMDEADWSPNLRNFYIYIKALYLIRETG